MIIGSSGFLAAFFIFGVNPVSRLFYCELIEGAVSAE